MVVALPDVSPKMVKEIPESDKSNNTPQLQTRQIIEKLAAEKSDANQSYWYCKKCGGKNRKHESYCKSYGTYK